MGGHLCVSGVQRYKKQGYWTEVGEAWCGLRLKVIRVKGRFYLCNRLLSKRDTGYLFYSLDYRGNFQDSQARMGVD